VSGKAILLFNLGGPESLEDVRPFLYNLFSDPDIIRIKSDFLRKSLAWLIAVTRQKKSKALYREIGGGSPLRRITEGQADALRLCLEARGIRCKVYVGMRCWKPSIDDAVAKMAKDGIRQVLALPLFPQFSYTTTGSCFNYLRKLLQTRPYSGLFSVTYVDSWEVEPRYIEAVSDLIREAAGQFAEKDPTRIQLLYSAHSIPARYVEEQGDPYLDQTRRTVDRINACLGNAWPSVLAFQSKVGPVRWLGPSTESTIEELARKGTQNLLAVPISFVSDHIETLQEIDILYKKLACDRGIGQFRRAASLNLRQKFIEALADIAARELP
jgi:protoporphyrin/coproporphyrin ferrochelatase